MPIAPWLPSHFLQQMYFSNVRDYPPKREKPWMSDFLESEEIHSDHFDDPWTDLSGDPPLPPPPDIPQKPGDPGDLDPCAGPRSLWVLVSPNPTVDCAVDTGFSLIVSPDFKCIELTQAFFDEDGPKIVDSAGNTLEHPTNAEDIIGGLKLEKGCNDPLWITLWVCDCLCGGCSTATIWLDNCGTDCDAVFVSGPSTIAVNGAGQYALINFPPEAEQVQWDVIGTGASIDQNGLLTTSGACGTLTITATSDCCGAKTKKVVVLDGVWVETPICGSVETGSWCDVTHGISSYTRYWETFCGSSESCGDAPCNPTKCTSEYTWYPDSATSKIAKFDWECAP